MNLHLWPLLLPAALCGFLAACQKSERSAPAPSSSAADSAAPSTAPESPTPVLHLPATVSFNEHIQPILSEYCYHCHGPDAGTREPKSSPLRLDLEADAFAPRDNGKPVILKGDPENSSLIRRIHEKDPDLVMPPPSSHKSLSPGQIALLEAWVRQGAPYEAHWSFLPVKSPPVPPADPSWVKNPIDAFVAEKLAANGLQPNPPEDLRRFFRRLHFDLTGLPPAPAEIDRFEEDAREDSDAAIRRWSEKLLATTASAEHFARHWLDAARYADTHGIHIDNYRAIWPYRDWVIRAFQQNMPWDRFTIEQIAGDLLPSRTLDQHIASGFNRCLATTGEGGAIAEEYEAIYAKDRVETTSAIWLGLTTGCAACHDHKFDPVSTREFYQLSAFFRNATMSALDGNNAEHPPAIFAPLAEDRPRWDQVGQEIAAAENDLKQRPAVAEDEFQQWLAGAAAVAPPENDPTLALHLPLTEPAGPVSWTVDQTPLTLPADLPRLEGPLGSALEISASPLELGDHLSFSRDQQVSYGGLVRIEGTPTGAIIARMNPSQAFRGWDLYLANGQPGAHVIDRWPGSAVKTIANRPLASGRWHHVMITFDGTQPNNRSLHVYIDGVRQAANLNPANLGNTIETEVPLRLGSRHGNDSRLNGKVALQDFRFYRRVLKDPEIRQLAQYATLGKILTLAPDRRTPEQIQQLRSYYFDQIDPAGRRIRQDLEKLKAEQDRLRSRGSATLVMEEKPGEPFAHVLNRGVYSDKGEKVAPGTPAILPPLPADAPKNRLGLARWLVDPANPLPARVTMNRTWYYLFGTGIVETNEDFGIMGARPSHPQLLDWLAHEFVRSGWDHRHMIRLIVSSNTYRQSAKLTPEKAEKDPLNRLLSRGPRYRLDAEQIRDLALSASGLMAPRVGGPPVRPYQPEGIWEAVAMKESNTRFYKEDEGEALYRRSLYTIWKRTAPHPAMEILNAPSREVFCVRRERTNTPLQAFVTLNDPQFVEASRRLAENALRKTQDPVARLDELTLALIGRRFSPAEREIVLATVRDTQAGFAKDSKAAADFIATGATRPDPSLPPAELAAWTIAASQVLNLDETLNK